MKTYEKVGDNIRHARVQIPISSVFMAWNNLRECHHYDSFWGKLVIIVVLMRSSCQIFISGFPCKLCDVLCNVETMFSQFIRKE